MSPRSRSFPHRTGGRVGQLLVQPPPVPQPLGEEGRALLHQLRADGAALQGEEEGRELARLRGGGRGDRPRLRLRLRPRRRLLLLLLLPGVHIGRYGAERAGRAGGDQVGPSPRSRSLPRRSRSRRGRRGRVLGLPRLVGGPGPSPRAREAAPPRVLGDPHRGRREAGGGIGRLATVPASLRTDRLRHRLHLRLSRGHGTERQGGGGGAAD